jgi:hypothetical protein
VLTGPASVEEGAPITLSGEGSSDPDGDPLTARWRVDGADAGVGSTLSLPGRAHGVLTVELTVDDGRGGSDTTSMVVTVVNLPPTVSVTGAPTVDPVQTWMLSIDTLDPWSTQFAARVEWGDGSVTDVALTAEAPGRGSATVGHTYAAPGTYTVTITACDGDDACTQATRQVTVAARPTPSLPTVPTPVPTALPPLAPPPPTPTSAAAVPWLGELPATGGAPAPLAELSALLVALGLASRRLAGTGRRGRPPRR